MPCVLLHFFECWFSRIADFLEEADAADAGESAARECLGIGLGELAEQFLGEGDWQPRTPMEEES